MQYILLSLGQSVGVVLLAGGGVFLGRWFSRRAGGAWAIGYAAGLGLAAAIAAPRWFPRIEGVAPFSWLMAGRTEFAAMALICTTLLTTPLGRLPQRRQRVAVAVFMVLFAVYFSLLPFLAPAFVYADLSRLATTVDRNGVCIQSNGYTCGPAAAVTVLRQVGVPAEEGALAIRAHATPFAGTPTDALCAAIGAEYGVPCRTVYYEDIADLRGQAPFIAIITAGVMVDHYVAVLSVTEDEVTVGDPVRGLRTWTYEAFMDKWRKCAIILGAELH